MPRIIHLDGVKVRHYTPFPVVDGGRNKFLAAVTPTGSSAFVAVYKQSPAGEPYHEIRRWNTPTTDKADHCGLMQSGANLHVFYTSHEGDTGSNVYEEVMQNVCVPYGSEGPQLGMPGAFVEEGGGGEPNPTPAFTLEDVLAGVANLLGISNAPPDNNLIARLRPHIAAKVEQLFKSGADGGSHIVWAQLTNTSYTGALAAITEGGDLQGNTPQEGWAMRDAAEAVLLEPDDFIEEEINQ